MMRRWPVAILIESALEDEHISVLVSGLLRIECEAHKLKCLAVVEQWRKYCGIGSGVNWR